MPDAVIHPTPQELTAFGLGKLPESAAAAIAAHLESCPACRQAVAGVSADSFLNKVRDAKQDKTSLPQSLAQPQNAPSSSGQPAIPIVPCPNVPPELANHPKYRISRELGRGGMGVVYQGWHKEMNRQIVIKVINRALLDKPEALDRFRREIQAAAQLSHPNIVTAHDAEQVGELHMLVMEFVPGQNLAEVLEKKGSLSVAHACHYMRQVAYGLQHAHERGMVHRDIKPQNLIRTPNGRIKILDFGLAKMVRERETDKGLTPSDACMGTAEFIAPEQAQNAAKADIRADLYSLGCTLYCLLAGRPPFREDTWMNTVLAHIQKQPQPLTELRPDVPERLWRVVARLMAKEPTQRYQKPSEVVAALAPFIKPGSKPDAKGAAPPPPAANSPVKGTRISADTNEIKNILREVPHKTPPKQEPAKEAAASPLADMTGTGAGSKDVVRVSERVKSYLAVWWKRLKVIAVVVLVSLALIGTAVIISKLKERLANDKTEERSTSNGDTGKLKSSPAKTADPKSNKVPDTREKSSEDSSTTPQPPKPQDTVAQQAPAKRRTNLIGESVDRLRQALKDEDPAKRKEAANILAKRGSEAQPALNDLAEILGNEKDPEVRAAAASAIAKIAAKIHDKAKTVVPTLAEVLQRDQPLEIRKNAAEALAQIKYPTNKEGIPAILDAIKNDKDKDVRMWCVMALDGMPKPIFKESDADKILTKLLDERDDSMAMVRYTAAIKLAEVLRDEAPDRTADVLGETLANTKHPTKVRGDAASAIAKIGAEASLAKAKPVVPALVGGLERSQPLEIRLAAARALWQINYPANKEAVPGILDAIENDENADVRTFCVGALVRMQKQDYKKYSADKLLTRLLDEGDKNMVYVRRFAARNLAWALQDEAPDKTVDILLQFLQDKDVKDQNGGDARYIPARALGRLGKKASSRKDVKDALKAATKDPEPTLREAAADALKQLTGIP